MDTNEERRKATRNCTYMGHGYLLALAVVEAAEARHQHLPPDGLCSCFSQPCPTLAALDAWHRPTNQEKP
jgi:hypothetical protein